VEEKEKKKDWKEGPQSPFVGEPFLAYIFSCFCRV